MKFYYFFFLYPLFFSCQSVEDFSTDFDELLISLMIDPDSIEYSDVLLKDFGPFIEIIHKQSGNYIYCQDCFNSFDYKNEKIYNEVAIIIDWEKEKVFFGNSAGEIIFTISTGEFESADYIVESIGYYEGFYPSNNEDFSFVSGFTSRGGKHWCQCVHESSTPCTLAGEDTECANGGVNAAGCSIGSNSGASAEVSLTVVEGGGTSGGSSSCSVECASGYYACCN